MRRYLVQQALDAAAAAGSPVEPICFTSCDGPHSGVADDKRPPHRDDFDGPARDDQPVADAWTGYGFTAADMRAWFDLGITEASVAAECRTAGFDPTCEVDQRFLLSDDPETARPFCDLLCDSEITAEQAWLLWRAWL